MKRRGKFITFEGTEGSGKSTQTRLLVRALQKNGFSVLHTREPGGTASGKAIRRLLLRSRSPIAAETETLLYMASRSQLVREVIIPALKAGKIVVCDRWLDATIAYQGYGLKVNQRWIERIARETIQGLKPDITLFLDAPLKLGLRRARNRGKLDRIEKRVLAFHQKVRQGYLDLAKRHSRICRVRVTSVKDTQTRILNHVATKLMLKGLS
jgi:dTMP kinase